MNAIKLVDEVIDYMGACGISEAERAAIVRTLNGGEDYGYGNMIAWLATAWAASLREQGIDEDPESFAGGRAYPLPPPKKPQAAKPAPSK